MLPPNLNAALVEMRQIVQYSEITVFLACIHAVENPTDSRKPGPCGELGPYQFTEAVWSKYTSLPFVPFYVCDLELSDIVARRHYSKLSAELIHKGIVPSMFNLARAWNGGPDNAWSTPEAQVRALEYARRVQNLVNAYRKDLKELR